MEKDFDLVVLTSNALFRHVKSVLYLLRLFALQLDNGTAVEADPLVHVIHLLLLLVEGDTNILKAVVDSAKLILQLVHPCIKSGDPIIETVICCHHGSLQFLIMPFGGIDLVD